MIKVDTPERLLGSKVVSNLGPKLYSDPRYAVRELIQNAYDSINSLDREIVKGLVPAMELERRVEVTISQTALHVMDKGTGMTVEEVWKFCALGMNDKQLGIDAGIHGIGTYAGATIGTRLEVKTKRFKGKQYYASIDFNVIFENESKIGTADYVPTAEELMQKAVEVYEMEPEYGEEYHFTHVKVTLRESPNLLFGTPSRRPSERQSKRQASDSDAYVTDLVRFLGMYCPVGFPPNMDSTIVNQITTGMSMVSAITNPIEVIVNHVPVYKHDPSLDITGVKVLTVKAKGSQKPVAQVWYGLHKKLQAIKDPWTRGIVLFKDGFAIDTPERRSTSSVFFKRQDIGYYFTGEMHLLDKNLVPNMERTEIPPSTAWEETAAALEEFFRPLDKTVRDRSDAESAAKKVEPLVQEGLQLLAKGVAVIARTPSDIAALMLWQEKVQTEMKPRAWKLLTTDRQDRLKSVVDRVEAALKSVAAASSNTTPSLRDGVTGGNAGTPFSDAPLARSPFVGTEQNTGGATDLASGVRETTQPTGADRGGSALSGPPVGGTKSDTGLAGTVQQTPVSPSPTSDTTGMSAGGKAMPLAADATTVPTNGFVSASRLKPELIKAIQQARSNPSLGAEELADAVIKTLVGGSNEAC